jgi:DNA polymerase-3 subunit alpha
MAHADFVHLRVHSAYSLSEGAIHVKQLAKLCQKANMPAVAITDTNAMFGVLEASVELPAAGVQPIIGCTLGLKLPTAGDTPTLKQPEPVWIVLLAQNAAGYGNLMKLVSFAHLATPAGETPHITFAQLEGHTDGLIMLTGGVSGPLGRLLLDGQRDAAEALLKRLIMLFPNRLYMEIQRHDLAEEHQTEEAFIDLAQLHDVPLVATNQAFFADEGMYGAHDALLCIAAGAYVNQDDRRRLTPHHRFKSAAEMRELFADLPEAVDNTLVVARRSAFKVPKVNPILPKFTGGVGRSEADELREEARRGLDQRLEKHVLKPEMTAEARAEVAKPYRDRLEFELDVIIKMDFPGYFLIVSDFIRWAKNNGVPVGPGRGSGAGSVVAWSLKITDLDPLRFGLLFERFLNPERVSMPDFDIDFCQDKRDLVIRYVQQKYGAGQVAQIITFGKLQARAVLRDVGRVLQMPYGQIDRLCKMIPNNPAAPVTLAQAIDGEARLRYERDTDATVARLMDMALKLEGLYRHASTHAAGVVIGDRPLDQLVPLYRDPRSDMPVTQFNMKWVEMAGLVKFDFLGLKTLTVLERAVELIRARGIEISLETLPLDDAATYDMLSRGETVGVFQLESSGMRSVLTQLKPDLFEDIIALVALYRPGPMDNIPSFIKRKHGNEVPDYLHPSIEPVLKETYGVIIYQEQVMQIAQILAGYSLGEADLLRRAMGKKIAAEMDQQRARFEEGAAAKGVDRKRAAFIFDLVAKFAGYGFNKSHAAAYALVAYQTAYLKANYPVEFLAASMTLDINNTDKLNVFRQELRRQSIPLLSPDVNKSEAQFSVEVMPAVAGAEPQRVVRYALAAVKNVGAQAMAGLVAERMAHGPFKDISDFAHRVDPRGVNKRQIENLVKAGAFDSLNGNRAQVFGGVELILRHANLAAEQKTSQQSSLFGAVQDNEHERLTLAPTNDWPAMERLRYEYEAIGFYLSAHPLDSYAKVLAQQKIIPSGDLMRFVRNGSTFAKLAGTIQGVSERKSQRGKPFAFLTMSDASGNFEVTLFSEMLAASRALLATGNSVAVGVDLRLDGEALRLTARSIESIDAVAARSASGLKIFIDNEAPLGDIFGLLSKCRGGRGLVTFILALNEAAGVAGGGREVDITLGEGYRISPPVYHDIAALGSVMRVEEV